MGSPNIDGELFLCKKMVADLHYLGLSRSMYFSLWRGGDGDAKTATIESFLPWNKLATNFNE